MDAIDQLKEDVRQGRVDVDRLIDVIVSQQRQLEAARQRIEELEKYLCSAQRVVAVVKREPTKPQTAWLMKVIADWKRFLQVAITELLTS